MMKSAAVFIFLIAAVYAFSVETDQDDSLTLMDDNIEERYDSRTGGPTSLPEGSECDSNGDHCQCWGKMHACNCPTFGSGKCICEIPFFKKHICIQKLHCKNANEWGPHWRSEEVARSPC